jgi:hypothetical protein
MGERNDDRTPPQSPRRGTPLVERIRGDDAYGIVLLLIFLMLLGSAFVGDLRFVSLAVLVLQGGTLLFAQWTSRVPARVLEISAAAVVAGAIVSLVGHLPQHDQLVRLDLVVGALLSAGTILIIVRRIGLHPAVTGATILGAVCVYLLLGVVFAYLYRAIDAFAPPFFAHAGTASGTNFLYYSYSSLTTVGYGDLTAEPALGRMLSVTEALMGQLYLVTVVALVVGNIGRTREHVRSGRRPTR